MNLIEFIIVSFTVWRITHLLSKEDGPFDIIYKLRKQLGQGNVAHLLDCFYCLSIWIAVPFGAGFGNGWKEKFLLWLAWSGAACVLEKITGKNNILEPPSFYEE